MATYLDDLETESNLLLAAEDCSPELFRKLHRFSTFEDKLIRSLMAHGPVLLRGGRGSGKSALMIEANRRIAESAPNVLGVYLSLRNLPLLRSTGVDYEQKLCTLLIPAVKQAMVKAKISADIFSPGFEVGSVQRKLNELATSIQRRIVLFFDDAAHLGRETPLTEFFDIYRTISSSYVSCKAAIYPGVTKFGIRFDVFNDATVLDVIRDERSPDFASFFKSVMEARYPSVLPKLGTRSAIKPATLAAFAGRTVVGNMRAFMRLCSILDEPATLGYPELGKALLGLASNHYWPLLDELEPKLGLYSPLIEPSRELAEVVFSTTSRTQGVASVIIHKDICQKYAKLFEILEYAGFMTRREGSRSLKSGGRGPRYMLSLANLLEVTKGARLSADLADSWLHETTEPAEIHTSSDLVNIELPKLDETADLKILKTPVSGLGISAAYPYGLTPAMIAKLIENGYANAGDLAEASEEELDSIEGFGPAKVKRIKSVVYQAIWM